MKYMKSPADSRTAKIQGNIIPCLYWAWGARVHEKEEEGRSFISTKEKC